jgi:hypothetical protein
VRYLVLMMMAISIAKAAQSPPDAAFGIPQKMKQNAEALKHYSYKRRTEISFKGKSRGARVELVRYVDGKRETVLLEAPERPAQPARGRGLRGRMIQKKVAKKKEEMKDEAQRLTGLLHSYTTGASDSMHKLLENATISRTGSGPDADIQVKTTGLVNPSDSFTLLWSVAQHRPARVDIHAKLEGKPVQLTVDYAGLPNGPYYPSQTVIRAPKKDLTITVDTFDYMPSGDAGEPRSE